MEIIMGENKPTIMIPKQCVDPKKYKPGDDFEYMVKGTVKSSDDDMGVRVELSHDEDGYDEQEDDDYENMTPKERAGKVKKAFEKSSKALEEYR